MPVSRCPKCDIILTDEERSSRACPACAAPFPRAAATPAEAEPARWLPLWPWPVAAAVAVVAFLLWPPAPRPTPPEVVEKKPDQTPRAVKLLPRPRQLEEVGPAKEIKPPPAPALLHGPGEVEEVPAARPYFALLAERRIKIDGDLGDWKGVPPVRLLAVERGRTTKRVVASPKSITGYIAHAPKGLLFAVEAVDTSGVLENAPRPTKGAWAFWDNDGIEVFLDTLNRGHHRRGEPNAHQFFASPFGTAGAEAVGGYESRILLKGGREDWSVVPIPRADGFLSAGKKTAAGWALEVFIPRTAMRHGDFKAGDAVGLEIQIDTGTNVYYHLASRDDTRVSMRPDVWAETALGGTDGRVEFVGPAGPSAWVKPGESLSVRVTDADARGEVAVSLRHAGREAALTLKETAPGVFAAAVDMPLVEGRALVVEYVDKVRADGRRDVAVRASAPVGFRPRP